MNYNLARITRRSIMAGVINTTQIPSVRDALYGMVNSAGTLQTQNMNQKSNASVLQYAQQAVSNQENTQSKQELMRLSNDMNQKMKLIGTDIKFSYSEEIKGLVVTVREAGGDKVIREIPSKEAIELIKRMNQTAGLIFDKQS